MENKTRHQAVRQEGRTRHEGRTRFSIGLSSFRLSVGLTLAGLRSFRLELARLESDQQLWFRCSVGQLATGRNHARPFPKPRPPGQAETVSERKDKPGPRRREPPIRTPANRKTCHRLTPQKTHFKNFHTFFF